jgi:AcrR family transcriptional regulator
MSTNPKRRGRPKDEQLTARRREEILDTAARVFAEHGYPGADVQIVANELEIGKGTVYRYFPTKRDLFLAAADRGMRRLKAAVDADTAGTADPLERVAQAVRTHLAFFDANPEFVELFIQERAEFKDRKKPTYFEHRDANIGRWQELLGSLVLEGRIRDVPVRRITDVLGNLLYGTMFTNHFAGRRRSFEDQAKDILDIVLQGVLSDRERKARAAAGCNE